MSADRRETPRDGALLLALSALALWLRWPYLDKGLWWDEYDVLFFGSLPVRELLAAFAALESHPPGYALAQKLLLGILGDAPAALRALSLAAGVATVPVTYALGRIALGRGIGLVAAAGIALLPAHVEFSTNARSLYPLFTLLATASSLAFARLWIAPADRLRRRALVYGVLTGLALLTHYYAVLVVATHLLCLVAAPRDTRPDGRAVVGAWALAGALFYPWFWMSNALPTSAGFGYALTPWVEPLGATTLSGFVQDLVRRTTSPFTATLVLALLAVGVARGISRTRRAGDERRRAHYVVALVLGPVGMLAALSALLEWSGRGAILQTRQLVFVTPPLAVLVGLALTGFASRAAAVAAGAGLALSLLAVQPGFLPDQRQLADRIAAEARAGDVVAVYPMRSWQVFAHAARGRLPEGVVVLPLVELDDGPERVAARLEALLDRSERLWVVERYLDPPAATVDALTNMDAVARVLARRGEPSRVTLFDGPIPWQIRRYDRVAAGETPAASVGITGAPDGVVVGLDLQESPLASELRVVRLERDPPAHSPEPRWLGLGAGPGGGEARPAKEGAWATPPGLGLPHVVVVRQMSLGRWLHVEVRTAAWPSLLLRRIPLRVDASYTPREVTLVAARTRFPTWTLAAMDRAARLALLLAVALELRAVVRRKGDASVAPTRAFTAPRGET